MARASKLDVETTAELILLEHLGAPLELYDRWEEDSYRDLNAPPFYEKDG